MRNSIPIVDQLVHTARLVPYAEGMFSMVKYVALRLDLSEEEKKKHIGNWKKNVKFNRIEMMIKVV